MNKKEGIDLLKTACESCELDKLAENYIIFCHTSEEKGRKPNVKALRRKRNQANRPQDFQTSPDFADTSASATRNMSVCQKNIPRSLKSYRLSLRTRRSIRKYLRRFLRRILKSASAMRTPTGAIKTRLKRVKYGLFLTTIYSQTENKGFVPTFRV